MSKFQSGITGSLLALTMPFAHATADFVCIAGTPHGLLSFADAADSSDGAPLEPPIGTPFLRVGESAIDLSQTQLHRRGPWYEFRDGATHAPVFSMRRVSGVPAFPVGAQHPFCDAMNWRESCWPATIVFKYSGHTVTVQRALCGVG